MSKVFVYAVAWLLTSLIVLGAFAQSVLGPADPPPAAETRRSLATEWASSFAALDRQIPSLSPSQEQWLQTEYHDQIAVAGNRYTRRSMEASKSIEYQISVIKPRNAEIINTLNVIATGGIRDKNDEVALWAVVSARFIDFTLCAEGILQKIIIPHLLGHLP